MKRWKRIEKNYDFAAKELTHEKTNDDSQCFTSDTKKPKQNTVMLNGLIFDCVNYQNVLKMEKTSKMY